MSTKTSVDTSTDTGTCTRTAGACAIGAGAAAITCKAMVLGFLASGGLLGMAGMAVPATPIGEMVDTLFTWTGLGLAFFGLVWAYYPDMEPVPPEWKERVAPTRVTT